MKGDKQSGIRGNSGRGLWQWWWGSVSLEHRERESEMSEKWVRLVRQVEVF